MSEYIVRIDDDATDDFARAVSAEIVQEVVRCGECRNYDPYTSGLSLGRGWCDALDTEVYDGFFCADGDRR